MVESLLSYRASWQTRQAECARHLANDLIRGEARPRMIDCLRPGGKRGILADIGESHGEWQDDVDRDDSCASRRDRAIFCDPQRGQQRFDGTALIFGA
jgi:hypothetical protein